MPLLRGIGCISASGRRFHLMFVISCGKRIRAVHVRSPRSFHRISSMTKTAFLIAFIVTALASMPAHAQRVFVSGLGLDTNPCTVAQPCRTFQQAYNTV
jgi:hypothetical protein